MTPELDFTGVADWRALAAHAREVAQAEFTHALGTIALGGVARLWHPRTGLRLVADAAALRAFFAETKQAF